IPPSASKKDVAKYSHCHNRHILLHLSKHYLV
uniref:Uncharacterized protein n=1 Tax=Ciona savignyi TaxID=51511 RepID=H2Y807_CIOSA